MALETDILPPRYRGPQRVGRGGMGEIYRATDDVLGRAVAIKVLAERYSDDEAVRQRFVREALAAARLSGEPNIVTIFDVGEWNERPFIVMEYVSGGSLEERVRRGAQEEGQVLTWLEQAARALDAAHANGIVHRDVKPANLLLDRNGEVHVADFGIASAAGLDSLTMTGTVLGTAGYLAPEQARGDRATPASDRYALAVVAFELLTGTRPFQRDSMTAEAMAHIQADVPSVCDFLAELPCELDPVFRRALAKDPADRYPSCGEFVGALRQAFSEAAGETRAFVPAAPPARPPARVPAGVDGDTPDTPVAPPAGYRVARPRGGRLPRALPLVLLALLAAALAGLGLAAVLTDGGEEAAPTTTARQAAPAPRERRAAATLVTTIVETQPGTTVEVTVTEEVAAQPATPQAGEEDEGDEPAQQPNPKPARGSISEGKALTDEATGLMRQGRWAEALPVAQRALEMLRGSGDIYEAYANYDVGRSLVELNRCDEAIPYLERREQLGGPHAEVTAALRKCGR